MSTCCFLMIPKGFTSAMSCRDIGGNGPPPTPSNQMPSHGSQSVQSVRRKLFGDVDHRQTELDLQKELRQCEESERNKYNFDFISEEPINRSDSRYEWSKWSQISTDSNIDNKLSTKLCKTSGQSSASQSQSANSKPESVEPDSRTDSSTQGVDSPTSAIIAPDSQPQPSSSEVELMPELSQKYKSVNRSKQKQITGSTQDSTGINALGFTQERLSTAKYFDFDGRKSVKSERKRSAAQDVSHKDIQTKRHRLECTSAVKPEDTDSNTTTTVTDTDVIEDEDSVRTTGTPV